MEAPATGSGSAAARFIALAGAVRRDRALHALAFAVLLAGFALQPVTGNRPDWDVVASVLGKLVLIAPPLACALLVYRLVWLALVARSRTPARDLLHPVTGFLRGGGAAAFVSTLVLFLAFAGGFAVLKGAIGVIAPFKWDAPLAELDRLMHFGHYPHEWLAPLLRRPAAVSALNAAYNLWFFALLASFVVAGCAAGRAPELRRQYLMSFLLTWSFGGFLVAAAFSSAGPVYYERLGLGELYAPLMAQLHAVDAVASVWALETQEALWQGFTGARVGSAGISAFPSMHVATATLFVLAARRVGRGAFLLGAVYWLAIMVGSVLLGWHYAVDGYAGAALALLAWRLAGLYARRLPASAMTWRVERAHPERDGFTDPRSGERRSREARATTGRA
jgi:membrane-associated phospholipid phosphatase